jgi:hypothetical protein
MNLRAFGIVAIGVLLCGCTDADWANTFSYVGGPRSEEPAPISVQQESEPVPPAAQLQASDSFCKGLGDSAGFQAAFNGFGKAYQAQVADTAYRQCMNLDSGRR